MTLIYICNRKHRRGKHDKQEVYVVNTIVLQVNIESLRDNNSILLTTATASN